MSQGNARNIKNIKIHRSVLSAVPLSILHEQSHHREVANLIVPPIHTVFTHVVHAFLFGFPGIKTRANMSCLAKVPVMKKWYEEYYKLV